MGLEIGTGGRWVRGQGIFGRDSIFKIYVVQKLKIINMFTTYFVNINKNFEIGVQIPWTLWIRS